jgi:beta-lactamase class C
MQTRIVAITTWQIFRAKCARACSILLLIFAPIAGIANDAEPFFAAFEQARERGRVPGAAIAIIENDRVIAQGFGQRALHDTRPVDADTVFRIASVSKTFTAQLASLLVGEGELRWDTQISGYVPQLQFADAKHTQALQLRHLLSHSSGIIPYAFDGWLDSNFPVKKIFPKFRTLRPICAPGACYSYQNTIFSVAAQVIEAKTGAVFEQLVAERIFQPLGMKNASFGLAALQNASNVALPHIQEESHWAQTQAQVGYYGVAAAAGVNASVTDLALWLQAQMGAHPKVIPLATVAAMTQPRIRTPELLKSRAWQRLLSDAHYGYGWRVLTARDEQIYYHSGRVQGYMAHISYSRKHRIGLVMLFNAERRVLDQLAADYWCDVLARKRGQAYCSSIDEAAKAGQSR